MSDVANAIRSVTAKMQDALRTGHASRVLDADDLIEALLAIADELDPPYESAGQDEPPPQ